MIMSDDETIDTIDEEAPAAIGSVEKNGDTNADGDDAVTFKSLGVCDALCEAAASLGWKNPSAIQQEALPLAFEGRDIIGLAETGSGKTAAFALPIIQALLELPTVRPQFALVLTPTRELALQIQEQMEAMGRGLGLRTCALVGGLHLSDQALQLAKRRHHVIVATPGRLVDHLENTRGFDLRGIHYLVLDEADRILNMDFEDSLTKILGVLPRERKTYLYSATMTSKVRKLQRACLVNPVKVEIGNKYNTVSGLRESYLFVPLARKVVHLVQALRRECGKATVVFASTRATTLELALTLRSLGISAVPLHGQMAQNKRIAALDKFRRGDRSVLLATEVASRGLDIPRVDMVVNYDVPLGSKSYVHRVGRTARAGRAGKALTLVSQYEVARFLELEAGLGKKLLEYDGKDEAAAERLVEAVAEATRLAKAEMKDAMGGGGAGGGGDAKKRRRLMNDEDDDEELRVESKMKAKRQGLKKQTADSGGGGAGQRKTGQRKTGQRN